MVGKAQVEIGDAPRRSPQTVLGEGPLGQAGIPPVAVQVPGTTGVGVARASEQPGAELLEPLLHLGPRADAGELGHDLPAHEALDRGDAPDAVALGHVLGVVGVDLGEDPCAVGFLGEGLEGRAQGAAGAAPVGVEVHHHGGRGGAVEDLGDGRFAIPRLAVKLPPGLGRLRPSEDPEVERELILTLELPAGTSQLIIDHDLLD